MENIAHTLLGLRIADLGWRERIGPRAGWIGVVAANLPDADLLWAAVDPDVARWYHRGLTHSFLGWPWIALAGAAVTARWTRSGRFRDHLGLWAACLFSHAMLDWPTTWGTLLFYPWNDIRYSSELIFIVDPVFWLVLGPLALPFRGRSRGAIPIGALLAWFALSFGLKQVTRAQVPQAGDLYPAPLAPFFWTAVDEGSEVTRRWFATPWSAEPAGEWPTPAGPEVEAVRATLQGDRWFWMANAPVLRGRHPVGGAVELTFSDLSFTSWTQPEVFRFTTTIDTAGRVIRRDRLVD